MPSHTCDLLDRWAREAPDRAALVAPDGRVVTFRALRDRVARLAGAMSREGLVPGDRVVLLLPMGIRLYEALLALLWGGHTAVLVDPQAGLRRMGRALDRIGVSGLVGTRKAHLLRLAVPALRGGVLYASDAPLPFARVLDRMDAPAIPRVPPPDGAPALLTFTTGTTGLPKAIGRSHAFLLAQHRVLATHMGLGPSDVDLPTLPVFLLNSLGAGATCVLPDGDLRDVSGLDPARITAQVRARGVTTTSGSPAFFRPLVDHLAARGETLSLERVFVGGARVPTALLADMRRAFPEARVEVVYGSTEAEPICTVSADDALAAGGVGSCVGAPVPGIRVRIVDPGGDVDLPDGEIGEVLVAGDHVNTGYYRDPDADHRNKLRDGDVVWHRTGDAARREGGRLWLVGRTSERIGAWWPFPVEAAAEALDGVDRAALVEVRGAPVLAYEGSAPPDDVARAAGVPRAVSVDRIPVDPRHRAKVDRAALVTLIG